MPQISTLNEESLLFIVFCFRLVFNFKLKKIIIISGTSDQQDGRRSDASLRRFAPLQHHGGDAERNLRTFRKHSVHSTHDRSGTKKNSFMFELPIHFVTF